MSRGWPRRKFRGKPPALPGTSAHDLDDGAGPIASTLLLRDDARLQERWVARSAIARPALLWTATFGIHAATHPSCGITRQPARVGFSPTQAVDLADRFGMLSCRRVGCQVVS